MDVAKKIINKMYNHDAFSKWLGIKVLTEDGGTYKVQMKINKKMTNGFGIAHGGIAYSLADSALAFVANANGYEAVTIDSSISYCKKVKINEIITANVKEISLTKKNGLYQISITNQDNIEVAQFKGTVYITSKKWNLSN